VAPAFRSPGEALRFGALLLLLLALPMLVALVRPPARVQVYRSVPPGVGPFTYMAREIFEEKSDINVLFDVDSVGWVGVDARYFQQQLSAALGRPATVVVLAANWPGMDQRYVLLRDMLERRRVGMLVLSPPRPGSESDRPHVQAFRWLQFGEDQRLAAGLSLRNRLAIYADEVLGAPRQLLSAVRPNLVSAEDPAIVAGLGSMKVEQGFHNTPFVRVAPVVTPVVRADDMILSARTAQNFRVTGPALSAYQLHFMRRIGQLVAQYHVPLTILHVPLASERGSAVISQQADWSQAFGTPVTVVGMSSQQLFRGMSDAQFYRYYYDEHLNRNGSELFTEAVSAALVAAYRRSGVDVQQR